MKYLMFDDAGQVSARFDSAFHAVIPKEAMRVTAALWDSTLNDTDGVWRLVDGELIKQPLPELLPDFVQMVADERYKREATGVIVNGLPIETTRDSQALIASTGLSALFDPDYRCNFKTVGGFVEIGAVQIIAIAKAVRAHVQACFDREKALLESIAAGEFTEAMLGKGWPIPAPQTLPGPDPDLAPDAEVEPQ